jgi:hypothetical protein
MTVEKESSLAVILGVGAVELVEPAFADLPDDWFTSTLLETEGDQGRFLVDEESEPLALAVHTGNDHWVAGCYHLRRANASVITFFEDLGGDIYQEERSVWEAAVRRYYSHMIPRHITPSLDDLNPARKDMVRSLLTEMWGPGKGTTCLDFCCGSGLGSVVLRDLGYSVLACDIDLGLLSLGFSTGRLLPHETMCFDATRARTYISPVPAGLGLMFGEIHAFNSDTWEQITRELVNLTGYSLITVGKKEEAELIASWVERGGCRVDVSENTRDPIYDRWVCSTSRD